MLVVKIGRNIEVVDVGEPSRDAVAPMLNLRVVEKRAISCILHAPREEV